MAGEMDQLKVTAPDVCGDLTKILQNQTDGVCIPFVVVSGINFAAGSVNTAVDVILAILPMFVLRHAKVPKRSKVIAGLIIAMGTIGGLCSVVRLAFIKDLASGSLILWNAVDVTIRSVTELGIGIVAAWLATLRPLLKCCLRRVRKSGTHTSESTPLQLEAIDRVSSQLERKPSPTLWTKAVAHGGPNYHEVGPPCPDEPVALGEIKNGVSETKNSITVRLNPQQAVPSKTFVANRHGERENVRLPTTISTA
ncbi:hypothetical protein LTR56_025933 [Elasticomyces elasticus]|nr:hypothetical protein LTR56_025933 [Elasticomyces elasticus]KAK5735792.1 hypothetical protein LTS12_026377 [Elasticomyces elasticus]